MGAVKTDINFGGKTMYRIKETRNVSLPESPDIIAFISPPDDDGYRIRFLNLCAGEKANIIRILAPKN